MRSELSSLCESSALLCGGNGPDGQSSFVLCGTEDRACGKVKVAHIASNVLCDKSAKIWVRAKPGPSAALDSHNGTIYTHKKSCVTRSRGNVSHSGEAKVEGRINSPHTQTGKPHKLFCDNSSAPSPP